jgi:peptidoglycan-associated lipoprotein
MRSSLKKLTVLVIPAFILSGCESVDSLSKEEGGLSPEEMAAMDAKAHGAADSAGFRGGSLNDPSSPLSTRVIYFEYDSDQIKPEFQTAVEAHAAYLASHPNTAMRLEGHADERGSREYNLALGERRAMAIRRQLNVLGGNTGQMQTVSYGEERPASEGHDEGAYSMNRRVEIVY